MRPFTYERATSAQAAARAAAAHPGAKFIAGGTNLLDLMKLQIEAPTHLVDVNGLKLDQIEAGIPSHVTADLTAAPQATVDEIRERMSGNICRCGAYSNIVEALTEVAGQPAGVQPAGRQG